MAVSPIGAALDVRPIPEFDGVREAWPRGDRLRAVRDAAAAFKARFITQGQVIGARSFDIAAASYPTRFAFHGATVSPIPYVSIVNRMVIVRFNDFDGRPRVLVWEPTVPASSAEAPFYAQLEARTSRLPGGRWLAHHVFTRYYHTLDSALRKANVDPAEVDVISFDHLHVQDPRLILPTFPHAKLLVHRKELGTFEAMHPMQWAWYVDGGMDGVPAQRLLTIDGDVELGHGIAAVWTPGHTDGNHSLVLNTPDGVWVSSENGVALDNWQPELSTIPGVKRYSEFYGREIVPNANTLEDSLDQYDSMVAEKTLADPCRRDPRWLQILPSPELAPWKRQWPVLPSFTHGGIDYGQLAGSGSTPL
jgi:hypothetical protein